KKSKVVLEVPHVQQISEKTAFAACAEMALKFFGQEANQRDIYEIAKSGDNGHATDAGVSLAIKDLGYKIISWWTENKNPPVGWAEFMQNFYWPIYWRVVKMGVLEKKEEADLFLIKEMIDKGIPVIAEVDSQKISGKKSGYPYFILIKGYSRKHFTYNDPSAALGSNRIIDFKEFEEMWSETPFSRKFISVIVKKEQTIPKA
ncbi:MAG TPA: C39 family peptidase, partial [archaeon]|nr:C39 family peptidase [archaeon]